MTKKELIKYFEETYLKHTCFDSFKDLIQDKTSVQINAPRALIAVELMGVWRGLNDRGSRKEEVT